VTLLKVEIEIWINIYHNFKKVTTDSALTAEALTFHTANTPHLPLPVAFHQRAPLLCVVITAIW